MDSKGFIPGREGLIPLDRDSVRSRLLEEKRRRRIFKKKQRRERREALTEHRLARSHWWGYSIQEWPTRRFRRAFNSSQPMGEQSRGVILDAYGEDIDRTNPGDRQFAKFFIHPCKRSNITGQKFARRYVKSKAELHPIPLMDALVARLNGGDTDGRSCEA